MSEIDPDAGNLLLEIKPIEEVINEPEDNNNHIDSKIEQDIEKEIEMELQEEQDNEIFEKKVKPKKKKRQLSDKQKKHLENMRKKKLEKARRKKEEKMKQFKEQVEGKTQTPINTHKREKPAKKQSHNLPQHAYNHEGKIYDEYLFKNMERMVGLMERMNKIGKTAKSPLIKENKIHKPKPIPAMKEQPKVDLYGYDDYF
tara:strand:+ start:2406 stop:3005 length:600 start_codon:yes stop_codon:yes gene_type:complete